ncbi:hypothetical protein QBC43DRAFT_354506 [Cladorrhinum sp. PSN259]|nr:hypothetical protein QBC43DRAFT_354506 [Cladorrhinum sp. PSN259]
MPSARFSLALGILGRAGVGLPLLFFGFFAARNLRREALQKAHYGANKRSEGWIIPVCRKPSTRTQHTPSAETDSRLYLPDGFYVSQASKVHPRGVRITSAGPPLEMLVLLLRYGTSARGGQEKDGDLGTAEHSSGVTEGIIAAPQPPPFLTKERRAFLYLEGNLCPSVRSVSVRLSS